MRAFLVAFLVVASTAMVRAHEQPAPAAAPAPQAQPALPPLTRTELRPGLLLLSSDIGNVLALTGPEGVALIDSQVSSTASQLLASIAEVTPAPVRYLINTHWHVDHSGGNGRLAEAGALVMAHHAVRARRATDQPMRAYGRTVPAAKPGALPVVTFGETLSLHLNGEEIHAFHVPGAHTDGDVIVRFAKADVLHLGDVFFNGMFPFIDIDSGGGVQGMIRAVERAVALAGDRTLVVPAHGPVTDRAALLAYGAMLRDVAGRVEKMVGEGRTMEAIVAAKPAAAYASLEGDADRFVGFVVESFRRPAP
ncbi:MAG TPA: MBL fold metallo-hydrolase [Azospirillaceae bacterium]|nr:MBL fold metallo-hydrolase [Azospirillaceae bacterium]